MKPPPAQALTVGGLSGEFRDWRGVRVCRVPPKDIDAELSKMGDLLASFLQSTSAGRDGVWAPEHLRTLEESQRVLPPALDSEMDLIDRLAGCKSGKLPGDETETVRRTRELIKQSRARVAEAPAVLGYVKAKSDLAAWKTKTEAEKQGEHDQWCPAKADKGPPIIYFAVEDEAGRTQWLFCDGSVAQSEDGGTPAYVPPETPPSKRWKPQPPATYMKAVTAFPAEYIRHAPKLPAEPRP